MLMIREIPYVFTKKTRKQYISEGRGSRQDEKYQKQYIKTYASVELGKNTGFRVNTDTGEICKVHAPLKQERFHVWTEDFDGGATIEDSFWFFNLKMILEAGGAQNRSIRELAHHLDACILNKKSYNNNYKFAFIIDGEEILKFKERLLGFIPAELEDDFFVGSCREYVDYIFNREKE